MRVWFLHVEVAGWCATARTYIACSLCIERVTILHHVVGCFEINAQCAIPPEALW